MNEIAAERHRLIHEGFPALRKQGLLARANYLCCQSCAGFQLAEQAEARRKKGWVFWHQQDEDRIPEDGAVLLAFTGATECHRPVPRALTTKEVGELTVGTLFGLGFDVEWNENENERIKVVLGPQKGRRS